MSWPEVSLIIAARNEGDNLVDMVSSLLETGSTLRVEIVVVDDGSTDGSGERLARRFSGRPDVMCRRTRGVGVAAARNLGAEIARGETLVFLDGHCWCPPGWLETLVAPLEKAGVGLAGPAFTDLVRDGAGIGCGVYWPHPDLKMQWLQRRAGGAYAVPLMPGGCDAIRRERFAALGGYDVGMGRWGSEGEELSLRVWASGHEVHGVPDCLIRHLFREHHPYSVDAAEVLRNRLRMATVHFPARQLAQVLEYNNAEPNLTRAMTILSAGGAQQLRARQTGANRGHVAVWFERFVDW